MRYLITYIFVIIIAHQVSAQNWTEPVNVSNIEGFNLTPDFCIDNNGVIHCVWQHYYELNYSKIFYSKSIDDGLTWSSAEDISLNTEKRLFNPHIIYDSENNLHVTYDYDIGNSSETMIFYRKYNGINWSEAFIISENWPGSRANKLVIDHNNRLYCTWFLDYNNGTSFYRYLENNEWSDVIIPYDNSDYHAFVNCVVDSDNNLHWVGSHHYNGQNHYDDLPIYFYYDYENDLWSDITDFGEYYSNKGFDIDLDEAEIPHLVYHQYTNENSPPNDGTFYIYSNGENWSNPELIVEDPKHQQILVDSYNRVNIFDIEKFNDGRKIVFYYYNNNMWNGYIVDEAPYTFFDLAGIKQGNKLHLIYTKSNEPVEGDIYYTNSDMITKVNELVVSFLPFSVFPNPFKENIAIQFDLIDEKKVSVKIYTIHGKLINTVLDENKSPGKYEILWNGRDENGKEVSNGLYLIRLQAGRNIQTRSVEYIK